VKRLYGVYEKRLNEDGGRDYLVGEGKGKFSFADLVSGAVSLSGSVERAGASKRFVSAELALSPHLTPS